MVKKTKKIKENNNSKKINNKKSTIKKKKIILSIPKNKSNKKKLQLTDIQTKIISNIKSNKSLLNYYYEDIKKIKLNKEIIEKVKESCLCRISDEFGTAVCINEKGYILTCSHAVPPFEDDKTKESLYIFPNGEIVKTLTLEKDNKIDLALLKIIEIYENGNFIKISKFPEKKFIYSKIKELKEENEKIGENIFCIGNPCFTMYNDNNKLEKNNYKPFWISFGKIKGYLKDKIYCKNELGPLIHNCWTYWGHSGAPIFNFDGELIGMHNSWNEKNADRHGNSLLGINKFLSKFDFFK
jgi:hypothetical protein